jgi:hypothetical protein
MIVDTNRGGGEPRLAEYLEEIDDNDQIIELGARGVVADGLAAQLREIVARSAHGRTNQPILHVYVSPATEWTEAQYDRYLDLYEAEFDLSGQPRLAVEHRKKGRTHRHYVYSVVRRNGRVIDFRHDYARREKIARIVECEFGEPHGPGRYDHAVAAALGREGRDDVVVSMRAAGLLDRRQPVVRPRFRQSRWALEADIDCQRLSRVAYDAWHSSDNGSAFEWALRERGLTLAMGDQVPVIVDPNGIVLPLARSIAEYSRSQTGAWIKAAEIGRRIENLALPSAAAVRYEIALAALIGDLERIDAEFLVMSSPDMLAVDDVRSPADRALIDDVATVAGSRDWPDFTSEFLPGAEILGRLDVNNVLPTRDPAFLAEIAGVINAVGALLNEREGRCGVDLRRDIAPVGQTIEDSVQTNANPPSPEGQNPTTNLGAVARTAAPSSPPLTSAAPLPPSTLTTLNNPMEQNHDERSDQQSAGGPVGNVTDDEFGTGEADNAHDDGRHSKEISRDGGRHEAYRISDGQDRGPFVERPASSTSERGAVLDGAARSNRAQSSFADPHGRGDLRPFASGATGGGGGEKSVVSSHPMASGLGKLKPVQRASTWQNALTRVATTVGQGVRKLIESDIMSSIIGLRKPLETKRRRSSKNVPGKIGQKGGAGRAVRPDHPERLNSQSESWADTRKLTPMDSRSTMILPISAQPVTPVAPTAPDHRPETGATVSMTPRNGGLRPESALLSKGPTDDSMQSTMSRPTTRLSASKIAAHVAQSFDFRPSIARPSPIIQKRVERTPEPDDEGPAPGM